MTFTSNSEATPARLGLIISAGAIFLCFLIVIGASFIISANVERRLELLSVDGVRESGDHLMLNYDVLLRASGDDRPEQLGKIGRTRYFSLKSGTPLYEEMCAAAIKDLKPSFVLVYTNRVYIALSRIQRKGIWVLAEDAHAYGTRELGERVWFAVGERLQIHGANGQTRANEER